MSMRMGTREACLVIAALLAATSCASSAGVSAGPNVEDPAVALEFVSAASLWKQAPTSELNVPLPKEHEILQRHKSDGGFELTLQTRSATPRRFTYEAAAYMAPLWPSVIDGGDQGYVEGTTCIGDEMWALFIAAVTGADFARHGQRPPPRVASRVDPQAAVVQYAMYPTEGQSGLPCDASESPQDPAPDSGGYGHGQDDPPDPYYDRYDYVEDYPDPPCVGDCTDMDRDGRTGDDVDADGDGRYERDPYFP